MGRSLLTTPITLPRRRRRALPDPDALRLDAAGGRTGGGATLTVLAPGTEPVPPAPRDDRRQATSRASVSLTRTGVAVLIAVVVPYQLHLTLGGRWLILVGVAQVLLVVADGVAAWWPMRRVDLWATGPGEAQVGVHSALRIRVIAPTGRVGVRPALGGRPWVHVDAPAELDVDLPPDRRGVFLHALVDVRHTGPFGLGATVKRVRVRLERPVWVAPAVGAATMVDDVLGGEGGERRSASGDEVVGIRPYVAGDARRMVHWPSTARSGSLQVRHHDGSLGAQAVVVADLGPSDGAPADAAAADALATVLALRHRGVAVVLVVRTGPDTVVAVPEVEERLAGRWLAAARPGVPVPAAVLDGLPRPHVRAGRG
jgi:uncharacterized protein (DUF58 family)